MTSVFAFAPEVDLKCGLQKCKGIDIAAPYNTKELNERIIKAAS